MPLETRPFDPAEVLDTPEAVRAYLADAFASGETSEITHALGVVARARGMSQLSNETGLSRESLYRALSDKGNPEFPTILKVMQAFGLRLAPAPIEERESA